jgi:agmatine deiminase
MPVKSSPPTSYRMPAEWEPHRATWIAWPYSEFDFRDKLRAIDFVYAEIVRLLSRSEMVEVLCHTPQILEHARHAIEWCGVRENYRLHLQPYDRSWLRDSAPTAVKDSQGKTRWVQWQFNAWAKYDNFTLDRAIPSFIAEKSGCALIPTARPDNGEPLVIEGGAIDSDGEGTLLTTEECLLSPIQERNPGLSREGYEQAFNRYLGISKTIWLGRSCEGDDTHGHVDDVARFVAPGVVVLSYEADPSSDNHEASLDNLRRLECATDAKGRKLQIVKLPTPGFLIYGDERLPASYANFYIGNRVVLVPTFNDPNDREVLNTLAKLFPTRSVVGVHAGDLILGFGTVHCLSQQEPA